MSVLIDVADATKDQLNDRDWGIAFDAKRVPGKQNKSLEDLKNLVVEVVPRTIEFSLKDGDRSGPAKICTIDIFLRLKMGATKQELSTGAVETEELDPLVELAETIAESFSPSQPYDETERDGRLDEYEDAAWQDSKVMSGPFQDKFLQTRIWQALIRLVFEV